MASTSPPPPSSSREEDFSQLLNRAVSLNQKCLVLSKDFTDLVGEEFGEIELTKIKRLSFRGLSSESKEQVFVMRVEGGTKKMKLNSLKSCFFPPESKTQASSSLKSTGSRWNNVLRIPVCEGVRFFDLRKELEVYELLDSRKERSIEELKGLVEGLERVEDELKERVDQIKRDLGLGERVVRLLNKKLREASVPATPRKRNDQPATETEKNVYFVVKEREPYVRRVRVEFEIDVSNERAIDEVENFERLIEQYYEVAPNQAEPREREQREKEQRKLKKQKEREQKEKEREEREKRFPDSKVIEGDQDKELLFNWLEESRGKGKLKKTSLLFQGSRDGFGCQEFHKRCDNQGPTVVVFRTKDGKRGGGYANVPWNSGGQWSEDPEEMSFLFSLDHKSKHVYKGKTGDAILGNSAYGPLFGGGNDLFLCSNCQNNTYSYSIPQTYALPSDSHLAGSRQFQVSDYEVWKIE